MSKYKCFIKLAVVHGHTVYHAPEDMVTLQLGRGGIIAEKCGIDVLCDLRIQDVAYKGQGAPLASLVDQHFFGEYDYQLNLGGIANVSICHNGKTIAWDIGPCNQLFNYVAKRLGLTMDRNGSIARSGKVIPELLSIWTQVPYFQMEPPKSLDNSWVKKHFLQSMTHTYSPTDLLATGVKFISAQLRKDLSNLGCEGGKMLVAGGGTMNGYLFESITKELSPLGIEVYAADPQIVENKEAILMAYMGFLYDLDQVNTVSSATGATKDVIAGCLYRTNE